MAGTEHETVGKLPFTAVAAPGSSGSYQSVDDTTAATEVVANAPSHQNTGPPATRKELWSYYAYYAGNNGIGSFQ